MKSFKIFGETKYFETEGNSVKHSISVDTDNNLIEIFGNEFNSNDLKKLDNFLDKYNRNKKDSIITLKYKQPKFKKHSSKSPNFFGIYDFPYLKPNSKWIKNYGINNYNLPVYSEYSSLGKTLSKLKDFNFIIEKTEADPELKANFETGEINISERFLSYFPYEIFYPLVIWIDDYLTKGNSIKKIGLDFDYFSTSPSKCILELLKFVAKSSNEDLKIVWFHYDDDEDMIQAGNDYKEMLDFDNRMILFKK